MPRFVIRPDLSGDAAIAFRHGGDYSRAVSQLDIMGDAGRVANTVSHVSYTTRYGDDAAQGFSSACRFNSFSADTEVATDAGDTLRAISQIQIGDYVLAWDEESNTISFYPVTDTIHHTDAVIVHLTTSCPKGIDGEELETTPEHPFYVEGKGWVETEDLQVGDDICNADGSTGEVEAITIEQTTQEMYNLSVDEAHTFYMGLDRYLFLMRFPLRT
jgi:hypothetical protein